MKTSIQLLCFGLLFVGLSAEAQIVQQVNFTTNEVEISQGSTNDIVRLKRATALTGYPAGVYVVSLVCDGTIEDSGNLLKN